MAMTTQLCETCSGKGITNIEKNYGKLDACSDCDGTGFKCEHRPWGLLIVCGAGLLVWILAACGTWDLANLAYLHWVRGR